MVAIAHPHPNTGLISLLMETNGLCPVERVTWLIALNIIMPSIIAMGWSQRREYPARTPRNRLDASEPPPSVIAL
jgi:hypothetical protein